MRPDKDLQILACIFSVLAVILSFLCFVLSSWRV